VHTGGARKEDDVTKLSPQFLRYQSICPDWEGFLGSLTRPLPTAFWVNTRQIRTEDLLELVGWTAPQVEALRWRSAAFRVPSSLRPARLPEYMAGFYHLQEEVSMLPAYLLDPQPGERILDLCAAPGNKTMQIALAMDDRGTLIANDWRSDRISVLRMHASRLGLSNIATTVAHGAQLKAPTAWFDRVLVDVPCSCEGTSRKHPSILAHEIPAGTILHGGVQIALLKKAVELCRPGGRIVYSTCTFRPEENEYVVDRVIGQDTKLRIKPVELPGWQWQAGLTAWGEQEFSPQLAHTLRIWPHQNDSGGFYIAVLEKES
jgi:16S rRNA C967 or C1407 C5-methylase (RsmB/RsmF family)